MRSRTPAPAFQVWTAPGGEAPAGRVRYPAPFWELGAVGLAFEGVPWLDELERQCRWIEETAAGDVLDRSVPACPGWDVG